MVSPNTESLDSLIEEEMTDYDTFPGANLLITDSNEVLKHDCYGLAQQEPIRRDMQKDTLFDLASLTKAIVTTTASMVLLEEGAWRLADLATSYLPRLEDREFTIHHLLTHTGGLPPWVDLFSGSSGREEALDRLYTEDWPISVSIIPPGERVIYSDIGFILLGQAIEHSSGCSLDEFAWRSIFGPLSMESTCFCPPKSLENPIAATEKVDERGGILKGEVHDENAYALEGVAGHAGLFSTAQDLGVFARMLLQNGQCSEKDEVLSSRSVELMASPQVDNSCSSRGLGWKLQGNSSPEAGDLLSNEAFGHTGFTGSSLWLDPKQDLGVVFLTNRVHPCRERGSDRIHRIRARVHNCASAVFGS